MICDKVLVPKIGGKKNNFWRFFGMNELIIKDDVRIENYIYEVRGQRVMLDSDLAMFFEYETKQLNRPVARNIKRFPENYCFQLTESEYENLRCQIGTSSCGNNYGGRRYLPYVFTEHGVTMLAGVLKSDLAIKMSLKIVDAFIKMKNYLSNSLIEQNFYKNMLLDHDDRIKILENSFNNKTFSNEIFYDGEIYDAYSLLLKIIDTSKKSIIVIDNYISKELLDILSRTNKVITIYSKNIDNNLINKYNSQYSNVSFKMDNRFHDRFIIIVESDVYHCGASFKDLGKKCFAINKTKDDKMINELLSRL